MAMTKAVAAARKRKKHQEARSAAVMWAIIFILMVAVSWLEYRLFDFVEPWVRIFVIILSWVGASGLFVHVFLRVSHDRGTSRRR